MKRDTLVTVIRGLLILMFLYASFSKIFDPEGFKDSMERQPFPHWLGNSFLFLVPASEIFVSILLLKERSWKKGMIGAVMLMSLFSIYVGLVLFHFFKYVPCSCGGIIKQLTWSEHFIFNLFFLAISIVGWLLKAEPPVKRPYKASQLSV
jgi:putative oxidoreductase